MPEPGRLKAMVAGLSTGGLGALKELLAALPGTFPVPILVVQHLSPDSTDSMAALADQWTSLQVKEADDGETPRPGVVYLAPANYHLQVETDGSLSLSTDAPVNYSRPSVDVLFETAARAHGPALAGIILTGAGSDGSQGLRRIQEHGGLTVVQAPEDAACSAMPKAALRLVRADYVIALAELPELLIKLAYADRSARPSGNDHDP
jgi:two-component system chemotaxis response regulator CheB